jgi:outer membrane protein
MIPVLVLLALGLAGRAWAAETKIGVVDVQRALTETEAGKKAKEKLAQRVEKMQADIKAKQDDLQKMETEMQKQSSVLSGEAKRDKEKDYDRKKRDLSEIYRDYQEEIQQAQAASLQPIVKDLEQVIEKIGQDGGYTVILEKTAGVIYSTKSIDITDQVIKAANEMSKAKK